MRRIHIIPLFSVLLVGCANPYRKNFYSTYDRIPPSVRPRILAPNTTPKLYASTDIDKDKLALFENGYLIIGYSQFTATQVDPKLALAEARARGAEIVTVQSKYARTLTETVPYTVFSGDQTTTITDRGYSKGVAGDDRQFHRNTEIRQGGTYETVFVPQQTEQYDQAASFWVKVSPPRFGAYVRDLKEEERQKLGSNRGLYIWVIVKGSPAFNADLFRGDIITKWNGGPVPDSDTFISQLGEWAGKEVPLEINRNGTLQTFKIKLNTP